MDLFENYDEMNDELKEIVGKYALEDELTYVECETFLKEVRAIGYTFEYGLDAQPFNLRKRPKVIVVVRGGLVSGACSDDEDLIVEVLDHDNWEDSTCGADEAAGYESLDEECRSMHAVY